VIIISFLLLNCYIIVLFLLYKGFQRLIVPSSKDSLFSDEILSTQTPSVSFTVVIPFRNEETKLPNLIKSLNALKFPKNYFEIIFIDDESTDNSIKIISSNINPTISYRILKNVITTNSPKKDAITLAVSEATGSWIVSTDADCEIPANWLVAYEIGVKTFDAKMLCAPVMMASSSGLLHKYQQADLLSLQGVTMGSFGTGNPVLCNGANLAFEKNAFYLVQGYKGNNHLASGDDVFMLQKMKRMFPDMVHFIKSKDAIVYTQAVPTWKALIKQRIRWASKTAKVKNSKAIALGLLVFLVNTLWIFFLILGFFRTTAWYIVIAFLVLKISSDLIFITKIKKWAGIQIPLFSLVISGFTYPFITCFVTLKSISAKYTWKGRSY
jgi:glycosyltransferase involved in cell wall biosynthesis